MNHESLNRKIILRYFYAIHVFHVTIVLCYANTNAVNNSEINFLYCLSTYNHIEIIHFLIKRIETNESKTANENFFSWEKDESQRYFPHKNISRNSFAE